MGKSENPLHALFTSPLIEMWLPAFEAAAIADPAAAEALGPYLGPPTEKIKGGQRPRVPGDEHFARTWRLIKPGFLGEGSRAYTEYANAQHKKLGIPAKLLALPVQWVQATAGMAALWRGRSDLLKPLWAAGARFGVDIKADPTTVALQLRLASSAMKAYFANVTIAPEQGQAFWAALRHPDVMRDLGLVSGAKVEQCLDRQLPKQLVRQYLQYKPRG